MNQRNNYHTLTLTTAGSLQRRLGLVCARTRLLHCRCGQVFALLLIALELRDGGLHGGGRARDATS
jgi:hypothetical protein